MSQESKATDEKMTQSVCMGKQEVCVVPSKYCMFILHSKAANLSCKLSQPCGDRQALFEQEAIEGVAAECFQVNLMFVIPELPQGVCTDWPSRE